MNTTKEVKVEVSSLGFRRFVRSGFDRSYFVVQ